jgi:radical SAM superfamily enzyme YgiQ (UPF0313 family)
VKIAFVDHLWVEKLGILQLVALLKRAGHRCSIVLDDDVARVVARVRALAPDLVCFSATTGMHTWALEVASALKRVLDVTILVGGPHTTYFPDTVSHPAVDYVCVGEGDRACVEAADALSRGEVPRDVAGLRGKDFENPVGRLIENLDELPWADREEIYRYDFLRRSPFRSFIVSRGCPYHCSFCYIDAERELYKGKGKFVRFRSPESTVEEIAWVHRNWPTKLVSFEDDLLTINRKWVFKFCEIYAQKLRLPFNINARADDMDEEMCEALADAGAYCVAFGVESGDEELRNKVLNKELDDATIVDAAARMKRHGIRFLTYNMVGLPGESVEMAWKTIALNRRIGADLCRYTLYEPYAGTALSDELLRTGALTAPTGDSSFNQYLTSPLRGPAVRELENLQKFFYLMVRVPELEPLVRRLIKLPPNPAFTAVFWATYASVLRRYLMLSYPRLLTLGARSVRHWFQ